MSDKVSEIDKNSEETSALNPIEEEKAKKNKTAAAESTAARETEQRDKTKSVSGSRRSGDSAPAKQRENSSASQRDQNSSSGGRGRSKYKPFFRRKVCKFCTKKLTINYRQPDTLRRFTTERGKILPRRITGTCAKHQRKLAKAIKRARALALLPFVEK